MSDGRFFGEVCGVKRWVALILVFAVMGSGMISAFGAEPEKIIVIGEDVGAAISACAGLGVEVLIHYSFPRHMGEDAVMERHDLLLATAGILGVAFYDVAAPDPTSDAGVAASIAFIQSDVPVQMKEHKGKKIAFFVTDADMQATLREEVQNRKDAYCLVDS